MNACNFSAIIALLFFSGIGQAGPLDTWRLRNPSLTANALHGLGFGNNEFVAVGAGGVTLGSTNGVDWRRSQSATTNALSGIAYGKGQFVAVGDAGTIVTSTDGSNWIQRPSATQLQLPAIAYGNGQFVAVGFGFDSGGELPRGSIVTSDDGIDWVQQPVWATNGFNGIAFANGMFVAVGDSGSYHQSIIATSSDGVNWVLHGSGFRGYLDSIAFGNGQFVAVGLSCSDSGVAGPYCVGVVLTSVDAVNWVQREFVDGADLDSIAYGNGQFVAVGSSSTFVRSIDGVSWTHRELPYTGLYPLYAVTYGNGQFVTVGEFGAILTSNDGVNWLRVHPKDVLDFSDIAYGSGEFVAVGNWYNDATAQWEGASAISPDGLDWTQAHLGPRTGLNRVTYGNGQFVASSYNLEKYEGGTNIFTSTDGLNWTQRQSGTSNALGALAYGNSRFVALAGPLNVVVSSDGVNWIEHETWARVPLVAVTYGNGQFVAVGGSYRSGSGSLASSDGVNWVQCECGQLTIPNAVAYGGGRFVQAGYPDVDINFIIASSPDGLNWLDSQAVTPLGPFLNGLAYGGGLFVAVGGGQAGGFGTDYYVGSWVVQGPVAIVASTDGKNWVQHNSVELGDLRAIAYGNGRFVAIGPGGMILESGSIITLSVAPHPGTGLLTLSLSGPTGLSYRIQSSTDLTSWQKLTSITTTQSTSVILDALPPGSGRVFYRAYSE